MRRAGIALGLIALQVAAPPQASARRLPPDVRLAPVRFENLRGSTVTRVRRGRTFLVVLNYAVVRAPVARRLRVRVGMRFANGRFGILVRTHAQRTSTGKWRWVVPVHIPYSEAKKYPLGLYDGYVVLRLYKADKPQWITATARFPHVRVVR